MGWNGLAVGRTIFREVSPIMTDTPARLLKAVF